MPELTEKLKRLLDACAKDFRKSKEPVLPYLQKLFPDADSEDLIARVTYVNERIRKQREEHVIFINKIRAMFLSKPILIILSLFIISVLFFWFRPARYGMISSGNQGITYLYDNRSGEVWLILLQNVTKIR